MVVVFLGVVSGSGISSGDDNDLMRTWMNAPAAKPGESGLVRARISNVDERLSENHGVCTTEVRCAGLGTASDGAATLLAIANFAVIPSDSLAREPVRCDPNRNVGGFHSDVNRVATG